MIKRLLQEMVVVKIIYANVFEHTKRAQVLLLVQEASLQKHESRAGNTKICLSHFCAMKPKS